MTDSRIELNGEPVDIDGLRVPALLNYGHFTSMQVREGSVRGLDRHLARLERATPELFGCALDVAATRGWMCGIVGADPAPLTLRVSVFSRALDRDRPGRPAAPDVLVARSPARALVPTPLRVRSVRYQRELPHIKHVGTFGLFHQKRQAQLHGFDDALFVDPTGAVAEGSVWNIGFFDGTRVTWPDAPALDGISMQLLKAGLHALGVESSTRRIGLDEIAGFRSAFFTNASCVAMPIACIDAVPFAADAELDALLAAAIGTQPWQRL
ncbi:MAG: aminotransferase class IV family protein [Rhodanobacteraceae bacterium]|jgi:branched-subunit amino acid aminotransferase/4-amino-4-deoxychorismate lyase|nr:aminotransferase class IV family protein [Rhodanobacteraceae bacterium]